MSLNNSIELFTANLVARNVDVDAIFKVLVDNCNTKTLAALNDNRNNALASLKASFAPASARPVSNELQSLFVKRELLLGHGNGDSSSDRRSHLKTVFLSIDPSSINVDDLKNEIETLKAAKATDKKKAALLKSIDKAKAAAIKAEQELSNL